MPDADRPRICPRYSWRESNGQIRVVSGPNGRPMCPMYSPGEYRVVEDRKTNTIPLPVGRSALDNAANTAAPGIGKSATRSGFARRTTWRLCRVSAMSRIIVSAASSRRLRASRRASAWTSRSRVSASTGSCHPRPPTTASHARRSRSICSGTSVRQLRPAGSSARNFASSLS